MDKRLLLEEIEKIVDQRFRAERDIIRKIVHDEIAANEERRSHLIRRFLERSKDKDKE